MRAAQYGLKRGSKRRSNNAALPATPSLNEQMRDLRKKQYAADKPKSREDQRVYIWAAGHFSGPNACYMAKPRGSK